MVFKKTILHLSKSNTKFYSRCLPSGWYLHVVLYFVVAGLDMSKTSAKPDLMGQITPVGGPPGPTIGQMPMTGMPMMGGGVPPAVGQMPYMGAPTGGAPMGQQPMAQQPVGQQAMGQQPMGMGYMGMGGHMAGWWKFVVVCIQ